MADPARFTGELFRFLRDLERNNDRDWFRENRDRYERHLRRPAIEFIIDFARPLAAISPHFRADPRPSGGSLFRIHRDTRFSRDKRPYKTHCGIQFRHRAGKDAHAPGYYVHLEPGGSFAGLGLWHPPTAVLRRIRAALAVDPDRWLAATGDPAFAARFELAGESLKRVPRDFPADHPLAEDLKRKDFMAVARITRKDVLAKDFADRAAEIFRLGNPLMKLFCDATGAEF